ncbi:MAG: hypothetical protein ACPGSC_10490 [Granulosicoccaceae bacterium]
MMKPLILVSILIGLTAYFSGVPAGEPPALPSSGFVTYSEGDTDQRTLYLRHISNGKLQAPELITPKGDGGDIMGTVSFDGRWLAFARNVAPAGPDNAKRGQWRGFENEDYHKFHAWDIYVVPLDGSLPAEAQRVGHGYWPSWGNDSTQSSKTLYYGNYENGSIMRARIDDHGVAAAEQLHSKIPGWVAGDHHMQASPDGRSVAIRIGNHMWLKGLAGHDINQRLGPGCHPSWMADSQWLYHANTQLWHTKLGNSSGRQGGAYHFGSSVDQQWAVTISDFGDNAQNRGWPLDVYAIDHSRKKISLLRTPSAHVSDKGSWPDIHTQ